MCNSRIYPSPRFTFYTWLKMFVGGSRTLDCENVVEFPVTATQNIVDLVNSSV